MRLRLPNIEHLQRAQRYAPRLRDLRGVTVGIIDGWGQKLTDGTVGMYPTMAALLTLLQEQYGVQEHVWIHKESVSRPVEDQVVERLAKEVKVVLNGQGL